MVTLVLLLGRDAEREQVDGEKRGDGEGEAGGCSAAWTRCASAPAGDVIAGEEEEEAWDVSCKSAGMGVRGWKIYQM
jgi:hypothetical protein